MSGGSYDYAYQTVERFAEALDLGQRFDGERADGAHSLDRVRFAKHLGQVAAAMKAIEWEDSFDTSPPLADEAIRNVIGRASHVSLFFDMLVPVKFVRAPDCPDVALPQYQSPGASGFDLASAEAHALYPGERKLFRTGLVVADMFPGIEIQIRPRSGLALKHGITVLNAPGTIDSDYRGELMVILINHGETFHRIEVGDRIAQAVVAPAQKAHITWGAEVQQTERGANGFGSSG